MVLFNPKLLTLFKRDDKFKVIPGEYTNPRFAQVGEWLVTEKMDGTSVILSIHNGVDGGYSYYGRTAKSQFTPAMSEFLDDAASMALFSLADYGINQVDLYAELCGPGIQGNPHGLTEMKLFVFDVRIGDFWLDWTNVKDVAAQAGLETVYEYPGTHTVESMLMDLDPNHKLHIPLGDKYLEGFVARTDPLLYDNQGNRIMWKLKVSDFA